MIDQDDAINYKTLLESTKAIPWKINWATKAFEYIGPQIEELLGWKQDSWKTAQDWIDRIHIDEREQTANYCIDLCQKGVDHEADYRALTADGDYVWVRDVVHAIREGGETTYLVGFMFDISERKKLEDELRAANRKLEALSYQDGLTGVANRRLYDQTLEKEWNRAHRNGTSLSLVVIDIDHFKDYNDQCGHLQGDQCLIQVANVLRDIACRSSDFFARYGGEEFVLLLPETGRDAARDIAERCRRAVVDEAIPHPASSAGNVVTISLGVASVMPAEGMEPSQIFEIADRMLYQAKRNGRNRIACSWPQSVSSSIA
ncbi:sensor domain-containing diguanylate cyclase [Marinobacterium lutimaris]|uniref:diguanylate cyclase n=1 Tax=Marinobacterium lutimaris TaxID=568106 RepID=A0A1H5X8H7_9GAMM|nr:sensor domain-containing diguanylate cyclase [Marinobacterium lutimaris]SEG07730.1 PAS domain S-box-containing protein/diguanylate cyclase (GGDEF) domain-containing protein [Marinobacterium lutimaris]